VEKFLVIEGRVLGGHTIQDLGLDVAYQKEEVLNYERANWSRDLNHALQQGLVVKKKVISGHDLNTASPVPKKSKPRSKPVQKHTTPAPAPPPSTTTKKVSATDDKKSDSKSEKMLEQTLEENAKLRGNLEKLMQQQQLMMEKFSEYMERPIKIEGVPSTGTAPVPTSDSGVVDDTPTFIPSKIRSGKAKTSSAVEIQSEAKEGSDQLTKAAEALKALRGSKKGKKKQEDSDD